MKVLGRDKLNAFSRQRANAKKALDAWFSEAETADWKKPQDIRDRYRSADFLSEN